MATNTIIHFAPLQGFTDNDYRECFFKIFGDIDFFYTPYLSVENNGTIKTTRILPNTNNYLHTSRLVPQVLSSNLSELINLLSVIDKNIYSEININLGCPYPMVTSKGRGASLIRNPSMVNEFIRHIKKNSDFRISLKIRAGLEYYNEIFSFLNIISIDCVDKIIVHPRTAKQLYKGTANYDVFTECINYYPNVRWVYNGDIDSYLKYNELKALWPDQNEWMIGRGLLSNPFLAWQIKTGNEHKPNKHKELLGSFCSSLLVSIENSSNDEGHAINRIRLQLFELFQKKAENRKALKCLKNARRLSEINGIINQLVLSEE